MLLTIDQRGTITILQGEQADALPSLSAEGRASVRRASHVVPASFRLWLACRLLRACFGERGAVAAWTRGWRCRWRARIVGGPDLGEFADRAMAIGAEIEYLERTLFGGASDGA